MTVGIDWTAVLDDLAHLLGDVDESNRDVRVPCSTVRLADALGVARGTLRGWLDGSEPRHIDGEAVLQRWCVLTGKAREFAPRERKSLTAAAR